MNIQNVQEFPCQVLNRDVWSNVAVKDIVSEHFIFWQIYHDSSEGQRYCQFYNVNSFPHIAIVDPRTGEKMRHWTTLDAIVFCEQVTEFIGEHASPDGSIAGPAASSSRTPAVSGSKSRRIDAEGLYEQSEEDQLKAAIAASLRDVQSNTRMLDSEDDSDEDVVCLDTEDDESSNTIPAVLVTDEKWEDFVGLDSAKLSQLVIRFPDGSRQQKNFPSDSKLKVCTNTSVSHKLIYTLIIHFNSLFFFFFFILFFCLPGASFVCLF